jgi:hypothetical protein
MRKIEKNMARVELGFKQFEKYFDKKYLFSYESKKRYGNMDIFDKEKFKITNQKGEEVKVDPAIVKSIFKLKIFRDAVGDKFMGENEDVFYGGVYLFEENLFKGKLQSFMLVKAYGKEDTDGISSRSFEILGKTVGKPKAGNIFKLAIFVSDYLLAVDDDITFEMLKDMEPYQLAILRLNQNINDKIRLFLELN